MELKLNELVALYENKDEKQLILALGPSFQWTSFPREAVSADFETFSEIKIKVKLLQVEIKKDSMFAQIYWEGRWTQNEASGFLSQSGNALFIFDAEGRPGLLEIRGESPFGISMSQKKG